MGFALIVLPFFLFVCPDCVPSTVILLGLLLSIASVLRERKSLDLSGLKFSVSGRFIGNLIAMVLIGYLSGRLFDLVVSAMILLAVAISLLPFSFHPDKAKLFIAGILSGIMGTLSSLDGPPIALLYQHQRDDVVRATLGGYFVIGAMLSLIALAFTGKMTVENLSVFAVLAPVSIFGFYASKYMIGAFRASFLRYSILSVSAASALMILVRTFLNK